MRLPCVLILFASATRPVGVGAHVEPSDVVTSDGRFEVQRHLRVQEGAHGDDVDERTNSFNFGEEVISSAEKLEPTTSNSIPRDSAPDTFKRLAESLLEGPSDSTIKSTLKRTAEMVAPEDRPAKFRETVENEFLTEARNAKSLNMDTKKGEEPQKPFSFVMEKFKEEDLGTLFEEANEHLVKMNKDDPKGVFELYQLNFAGDKLFEQPQLSYWVHFLDLYNGYHKLDRTLLSRLLDSYSMDDLFTAIRKAPNNEVALRVEDEIKEFWLSEHHTPDDAFTFFNLDKTKDTLFDDPSFPFWTSYFTYYNSKVPETSKVSLDVVLEKYLRPYWYNLLEKEKDKIPAVVLPFVEKEVKKMLLKFWNGKGASEKFVQSNLRDESNVNTVYGSALRQAAHEYLQSLPMV
ncbi:unnamed protein product [Peronospora effusa]|nr:unnamed protein product [Peronospora effusa]